MKRLFLILLFCFCVYSQLDTTKVPNTFTAGTRAVAADVVENFDSLEIGTNRVIKWLNDSNWTVDTISPEAIRGDPDTDSLSGNPVIDSIQGLQALRGNPDVDSLSGNPVLDSSDIQYLDSDTIVGLDSINSDNATLDTINCDSIKAPIAELTTVIGNPTIDSAYIKYLACDSIVNVDTIRSNNAALDTISCDTMRANKADLDTILSVSLLEIGDTITSVARQDYSGTSVVEGFVSPNTTVAYVKIGQHVTVYIDISGTSNTDSLTFTLPSILEPNNATRMGFLTGGDNSSDLSTPCLVYRQNNKYYVCTDAAITNRGNWTSSGSKYASGHYSYITDD
jgi:hypothetical protein